MSEMEYTGKGFYFLSLSMPISAKQREEFRNCRFSPASSFLFLSPFSALQTRPLPWFFATFLALPLLLPLPDVLTYGGRVEIRTEKKIQDTCTDQARREKADSSSHSNNNTQQHFRGPGMMMRNSFCALCCTADNFSVHWLWLALLLSSYKRHVCV